MGEVQELNCGVEAKRHPKSGPSILSFLGVMLGESGVGLGSGFVQGQGVPSNPDHAVMWLRLVSA